MPFCLLWNPIGAFFHLNDQVKWNLTLHLTFPIYLCVFLSFASFICSCNSLIIFVGKSFKVFIYAILNKTAFHNKTKIKYTLHSPHGGSIHQQSSQRAQFGDWGRRVAHTMHCTADKGCVWFSRLISNSVETCEGVQRSRSLSLRMYLDLVRIRNLWAESSANGPTNPQTLDYTTVKAAWRSCPAQRGLGRHPRLWKSTPRL